MPNPDSNFKPNVVHPNPNPIAGSSPTWNAQASWSSRSEPAAAGKPGEGRVEFGGAGSGPDLARVTVTDMVTARVMVTVSVMIGVMIRVMIRVKISQSLEKQELV